MTALAMLAMLAIGPTLSPPSADAQPPTPGNGAIDPLNTSCHPADGERQDPPSHHGTAAESGAHSPRNEFDKGFDGDPIETPFDTELTGTPPAGDRSFSFRPRTRDLTDNSYIRFPLRFRYGLTDHLELFSTLEGYVDNPARAPSEWGISRFEPGIKWQWEHPPDSAWRLALGGSWELPLGRPPEDIQDGFARVRPFVVVTRPGTWKPYLLPYVNLGAELVHEPLGRPQPEGEQPRHRLTLQPGMLWNPPGPWRGVFETRWRTDAIDGGNKHEISLRPGLARELPQTWLGTFGLRGRAELGLSLDIPVSGGGGVGTSVSARYQFTGRR